MAWALAGVAAVLLIRADAKRDARQEAAHDALERKAKTIERIERADKSAGVATDDADWLRNRGMRKGQRKRPL
jgi:membrane protein implicated in regulation of membrane protease activity